PDDIPGTATPPLAAAAGGLPAVADLAAEHVTLQRTLLLAVLILLGLVSVLRLLRHGEQGRTGGERLFVGWSLLAVLVYVTVLYLPPAAYFFELAPLTLPQWGLVLAVAVPAALLCLLLDRVPL